MIQHGVFAVAEHAITTASATSANEARSRALALYRKWQKSVRNFALTFCHIEWRLFDNLNKPRKNLTFDCRFLK
jgi:hypothetical protein